MEKQLMQNIFIKLEEFAKSDASTCGIRLYLTAATQLNEYSRRLTEITEGNEPTDAQELQEMNSDVENILINLGIQKIKKERGSES